MLERYTRVSGGEYVIDANAVDRRGGRFTESELYGDVITRLALYENTGLSPGEVVGVIGLTGAHVNIQEVLAIVEEVARRQERIAACSSAEEREQLIFPYIAAVKQFAADQETIASLRKELMMLDKR